MATDSNTDSNATADTADLGTQIAANLAGVDEVAVQRLQTLAWAHQARAAQLSRTAASLSAQYGPDDSDVKSAEAAAAAAKATAAQIAVVHHQVSTANPQVTANGWALHGRVFDADLAPSVGYTVFLVDATKSYQQAFGFAYTDDTGYYLLNYSGRSGSYGTASGSGKGRSAASESTVPPEYFIEVVDNYARPVFLSTKPFEPVIGGAKYQNIVLPAGQPPIGDLPPEIRRVAIPKAGREKKKS